VLVHRFGVLQSSPQDGAADQLLGKRGGRARRPLRRGAEPLLGEEAPGVEPKQLQASGTVGKRDLDGKVHPTRSLGEGPFQVGDAVRRQEERDVGVGVEAVERIEHLEEQGLGATHPHRPVVGDEVAVLQDDDGRLVRAGDLGRGLDVLERTTAQQDRGGAGTGAEEVAHGVGLARAGRAVEQDAAFEVLPVGTQPLALLRDAEDVVADPVQEPDGKDHVGLGEPRSFHEGHAAIPRP